MRQDQLHNDWLSLIEISGPFLALPVLKEVFPQGLEELDSLKRKRLRQAYEEWREAWETNDLQFPELHAAWINEVLARVLEFDQDGMSEVLKRGDKLPESLHVVVPEHGVSLAPDFALINGQQSERLLLLIKTYPVEVDLESTIQQDGWASTPAERMVHLCRETGCRLGIVTNGERWMLVDAPVGAVTSLASWYARIWDQEPITLQAFVNLLGVRRFFVDATAQLPALIDRSLKYQDEVTEALGEQVRRAVEVLIHALDRADLDRNRELLRDVSASELYEAGLTVMMRLVFLLSAEERGLLLLGDERYEAYYALSTLRMQLRAESEEILERRKDAWSRLLAAFRAVYGGIEHENLRMTPLGGSLFDPDRFTFLEGRAKGSNWRYDEAQPLPIDNHTVLLLLDAIQQFEGRTLSYRALDVEQIGFVYEGLLEREVNRTDEVTVELDATKNAKMPWVTLGELESAKLDGMDHLIELLQDRLGSSASRVRNDMARPVEDTLADRLLAACQGDLALRERIRPYAHLLRIDSWGYPLVYPKGSFIVTTSSDRRESGTHYTPKSLTEAIVAETLTPLAYAGPVEGQPKNEWILKSASELLELKVCDPAMGSGAFLVQACRWLSDRLVEAWGHAEAVGQFITIHGEAVVTAGDHELLPRDKEVRAVIARRLIAERCLYGVDQNPLAVELAKLSIWLVTLAKGRPFGFLDHNLRCGDSLLGIHRLDQLTELTMTPGKADSQMRVFGQNIEQAVREAIELRRQLREMPIRDIHDVETQAQLDANSRRSVEVGELVADAFIGEVFTTSGTPAKLERAIASLAIEAERAFNNDQDTCKIIVARSRAALLLDLPEGKPSRRPFHWPLEYPEVFGKADSGFDAMVGNPPFVGGQLISGSFGPAYKEYLTRRITQEKTASVDLVVYFFLRAFNLLRSKGSFGLIARRSLSEGRNREVGLEKLPAIGGIIYLANTDIPWPGKASVVVHQVHVTRNDWRGKYFLNGQQVPTISSHLRGVGMWSPVKLSANRERMFQGTILLGEGFKINEQQANDLITKEINYELILSPFIGGNEVNTDPDCNPMCWVINFWDWPEQRAKEYHAAYEIVQREVKPSRALNNRKERREKWWLFAERASALYHSIGRGHLFESHPKGWSVTMRAMDKVLVISTGVTKYPAFTFLPSNYIYSNKLCVLADDRYSMFAVLSSDLHGIWSWANKTSLGADLHSLVYVHGNIFETFPFPKGGPQAVGDPALESLGKLFYERRQSYILANHKGLTKFYNDFHRREIDSPEMNELRTLQSRINDTVLEHYGWSDIEPAYRFHNVGYLPEGDNTRFTFSEEARVELLSRLAQLNKERYEDEIEKTLRDNKKKTKTNSKNRRAKTESQQALLKEEGQ